MGECCELRASCPADVCDSNPRKELKASPPLCRGVTCQEDECCEYFFAGYKRTHDYLPVANAIGDTSSYSTPSDGIDACNADGACSGITCSVNSDNVAIGPCLLRASGATTSGDGTDFVSFVTVQCTASLCTPTTDYILKTDDSTPAMPSACTGGGCDLAQCS